MVVLESPNQMEFHQVGCSEYRKSRIDYKTNKKITISLLMFCVEFCLLTITRMLQYCKSLFYPYPLIETCFDTLSSKYSFASSSSIFCISSCGSDRILFLCLIALLEAVEELTAVRRMLIFKTLVVWKLKVKRLCCSDSLLFRSLERNFRPL